MQIQLLARLQHKYTPNLLEGILTLKAFYHESVLFLGTAWKAGSKTGCWFNISLSLWQKHVSDMLKHMFNSSTYASHSLLVSIKNTMKNSCSAPNVTELPLLLLLQLITWRKIKLNFLISEEDETIFLEINLSLSHWGNIFFGSFGWGRI